MIIAEAGVNHNGNLDKAKQLVDVAAVAGADAIKFQTFQVEDMVVHTAKKAKYQILHTGNDLTQFEMLKELELDRLAFKDLSQYCRMKRIEFMSSPFDTESIEFLDKIGLGIFKIPSGEITNYSYLKKIAALNKRIILSTGMATVEEVAEAIDLLSESTGDITLLHCTSSYPTAMEDVNLKAMCTLKQLFHKKVGFSDHTLGIEASIAAVALGASVIEKHITLDNSMPGPDHKMSLEPDELKRLVKAIRNVEQALGDGIKSPTDGELKNREFVRKSLVAARDIRKGEVFTKDNLCAKRAGYGISPMGLNELIGRNATRNYEKDERIDE